MVNIHAGDCRAVMRRMALLGEQFDAVITDPPYFLESVTKRFGKEGSAPAKAGTDGRFTRASKGFMGKCFHPDTEIMTKYGWRRVGLVALGDTVATLNPATRELEWQPVKQVHSYPFDGEMVHVKHERAEQMITPNHLMLVSVEGRMCEPSDVPKIFSQFSMDETLYCTRNMISRKAYKGRVHCVGVENHIIYTQFNGKPVWSGNSWDGADKEGKRVAFEPETWALCLELLKPGAFCLAFASARTGHWQAAAMEMAGFTMHPFTGWVYGQGMSKGHSVSRDIDKIMGAKGKAGEPRSAAHAGWIARGRMRGDENEPGWQRPWMDDPEQVEKAARQYLPASPEAQQWDGWYSGAGAIKPCLEPIYIGQKPRDTKTDALNVLKHGVGAYNIDESRVGTERRVNPPRATKTATGSLGGSWREDAQPTESNGRWPANLVLSWEEDSYMLRSDVTDEERRELFEWMSENP